MCAVRCATLTLNRCAAALLAWCWGLAAAPAAAVEPMSFVMEPLPPFVVDDKGVASGPFPDIVRAACHELKRECQFTILPWRRALALAEAGKADGIFVFVRSPEREKLFHFTDPVLQTAYTVFARSNTALEYHKPDDIDGYTLAVYGPSGVSRVAEDLAKQLANLRVIIEVDNQSVLRKLSGGRYGARGVAVLSREVGDYLIARDQVPGVKPIGEVKKIDYAIGLSRQRFSVEQAAQFNAVIRHLARSGTTLALAERYGMKAAVPSPK